MRTPHALPPLQRPEQLLGTVTVACYGGPLDAADLKLFERMALIHVYRDTQQFLWVVLDKGAQPPPLMRGDERHPYILTGHYAPGRDRRGGFALTWFTAFGAACRASLRPTTGEGMPALPLLPPPPLPLPGAPFTLPPGYWVYPPPALTGADLASADHAEGEALASLCQQFLLRPPVSVTVETAAVMLAACARWLGEVTVGGVAPGDRLRLERHAERFEPHPYLAHVATRILDVLSTWEAIYGDGESGDTEAL